MSAKIKVRVPSEQRDSLGKFLNMPPETQERLIDALVELGECSSSGAMTDFLASRLEQPALDLAPIVEMFVGMQATLGRYNVSEQVFVDGIATSVGIEMDETGRSSLARALGAKALAGPAKARELFFERDKILRDSRVLTDIRPVFGESDEPISLMVSHTLRLRCVTAQGQEEHFVSLTRGDVEYLQQQMERALKKDEKLRALMSALPIPVVLDNEI